MSDAQRAEIAKLEALHAEHPQGRIFTHLAEAYRKAAELERAKAVLREGLERHPDYSSAHVVMARVLLDGGERGEAAAEFRRVLELDSHNLVALRALGDMAREDGRTFEAVDYYERLIEVEPADEEVHDLLASLREAPAQDVAPAAHASVPHAPPEEGVAAEAEAGIAEDAGSAGTVDDLDMSVGPLDPAASHEREVPEEPEGADAYGGLATETIAQVYARQGLYDRAADVYRQLLRERPDDHDLRTRLEEMDALARAPAPGSEPDDAIAWSQTFDA
ncbi:MAG TPA: tetratricopeptide repeat protein, partial [Longimicrobiales bacterium]|nr:tetratricopeptide repeat protein [Longimicrobiales bacterium]